MRGPLAWPLLLLMRRAPLARAGTSSAHEWTRAVRAWTPATGNWTASAHEWTRAARSWTPAARAWTSSALEWTRAARAPTLLSARPGLPGGAGLARAPGRWAGSQGSGLQGGPAAAAGAGTEAGRHGPPASPGEDWRSRPAVAGRSEARKLLGLVRPERGRLAGREPCREGPLRAGWPGSPGCRRGCGDAQVAAPVVGLALGSPWAGAPSHRLRGSISFGSFSE